MPRKDVFHEAVKAALIHDGWEITHDPYILKFGEQDVFVDLGAEAAIGAEKAGRKIAVAVKSFPGKSGITELQRALGQYIFYRHLMRGRDAERDLFLAVPVEAYNTLLDTAAGRDLLREEGVKLSVYRTTTEEIVRWTE